MLCHRYNIIGDLHGSDAWKYLVRDDYSTVFIGDYFDPYTYSIPYEKCRENFCEILDYKNSHPRTVLLIGNHELHYLLYGEIGERYSRFDEEHAIEIQGLLKENATFLDGIAFSVNNKFLITHAGVSNYWYHRWFGRYGGQTPDEVAAKVNDMWEIDVRPFLVHENMKFSNVSDGPNLSPLWIRPAQLEKYNLFEEQPYLQVFGHTPCDIIEEKDGLICVDCLRRIKKFIPGTASLII